MCREQGLPCAVIAHGVTLAAAERADYPASARQRLYDGLRGADHVIAVAQHLAASLRALGVERVSAIANAADTERFRPAPRDAGLMEAWRIGPDQQVVAQVASLKAPKRPLDLVRAAQILAGEGIELLHVVVGDGPGRTDLEEAVRAAGLEAAFRFPGEVEHARMPDVMRLADMIVLASEREGFPLIYGEAQACGRVVVASDIPAAREAIVDGETGVLFRVGDAVDLAAKLRELAGDRTRCERIGRKARAATEGWNAASVARAYSLEFGRVVREVESAR
jgi:glycosyltransferase involved in cell wall biosynthesis